MTGFRLDAGELAARVHELAAALAATRAPGVVLAELGPSSRRFADDLSAALPLAHERVVLRLRTTGAGRVGLRGPLPPLAGRDVVVVTALVDTGLTLHRVLGLLERRRPAALGTCALLDRRRRRLVPSLALDHVGFAPADDLAGYGLGAFGDPAADAVRAVA